MYSLHSPLPPPLILDTFSRICHKTAEKSKRMFISHKKKAVRRLVNLLKFGKVQKSKSQTELRKYLLPFGSQSSAFHFAVEKHKD
jgi:hypothetical protein